MQVELALPGETRVLQVLSPPPVSLNIHNPPVTGALGVIGLSGRASRGNPSKEENSGR